MSAPFEKDTASTHPYPSPAGESANVYNFTIKETIHMRPFTAFRMTFKMFVILSETQRKSLFFVRRKCKISGDV